MEERRKLIEVAKARQFQITEKFKKVQEDLKGNLASRSWVKSAEGSNISTIFNLHCNICD